MIAIGLMSGTSADGIDGALVAIEGEPPRPRLLAFHSEPYPDEVRAELFALFHQEPGAVARLARLNYVLGELFAEAALAVAAKGGVPITSVAFIASHGQTVWHQPEAETVAGRAVRATLQIGEPCVIAERTGVPVIADFRARDIAAGGEGAPLVPYCDYLLFADPDRTRAVQNLGGIGNVTFLPAGARRQTPDASSDRRPTTNDQRPLVSAIGDRRSAIDPEHVIAFDTGPGNMAIDAAASLVTGGREHRDTDGHLARAGTVNAALLEELLADPYLHRAPPKSTGRERYGAPFVRALWDRGHRGPDLVATLTAFTAATIADAYARWLLPIAPIDEVILGGGGVHNPALVAELRSRLAPARVTTHEEFGIPDDAKEAIAFALLGYETFHGRPSNLPSATGASRPVVLGVIVK
jgi:anhydro-N-acetylmuramic acid kinase